MKKKNLIGISLISIALASCDTTPSFHIKGEISDTENEILYLEHSALNGIEILDSTKLGSSGKFDFKQPQPESPDFYRLRIGKNVIHLSVDSTETISVSADVKNFSLGYSIINNENNEKIKELVVKQAQLQERVNLLGKTSLSITQLRDSVSTLIQEYKEEVKRDYIYKHPNTSYAYFALYQELNGYLLFDPLTNREDNKAFAAVATSLNQAYPHADRSRNLYNTVIRGMRNTHKPVTKEIEIPEDKIQEASLIDIPLRDVNGNLKSLTAQKGKVVLLDFTIYSGENASAHNLLLRELYNKYASQGLEIFQVSFDGDEHFWKTAADALPWICVRDPQGVYSPFINLYSVQSLPTMYLINKQNEISIKVDGKTDLNERIKQLL